MTEDHAPTSSGRRLVKGHLARTALRRCVVGLVLVAALAAGCSSDDGADDATTADPTQDTDSSAPSEAETSTATESTQPETTEAPVGDLDAFAAIAVAIQTTPGAVIDIGQDTERGQAVWEVVVGRDDGTGIEHYIAVATGEVLKQEPASVPPVAATLPAVPIEDALRTALQTVPDSQVVEADLDTEGSVVVWEVLVRPSGGPPVELYIDATSGEVIKQEVAD